MFHLFLVKKYDQCLTLFWYYYASITVSHIYTKVRVWKLPVQYQNTSEFLVQKHWEKVQEPSKTKMFPEAQSRVEFIHMVKISVIKEISEVFHDFFLGGRVFLKNCKLIKEKEITNRVKLNSILHEK